MSFLYFVNFAVGVKAATAAQGALRVLQMIWHGIIDVIRVLFLVILLGLLRKKECMRPVLAIFSFCCFYFANSLGEQKCRQKDPFHQHFINKSILNAYFDDNNGFPPLLYRCWIS